MPSFDIVSKLKKDEVQNAVDNANRELQTRYDFRGVEASYNFDKTKNTVKVEADEEFQVQQNQIITVLHQRHSHLSQQHHQEAVQTLRRLHHSQQDRTQQL